MIVVVNYGVGNLASVSNMLRRAGASVCVSDDPAVIAKADKLLLPGVGHFDHGMGMLRRSGLLDVLDEFALHRKRPILGICLGAQMLGRGSEEGNEPGLGWIDMECRRLPSMPGIRVPHMGWAEISQKRGSALLSSAAKDARYYFVHSFFMKCNASNDVVATATHGVEFTCAVQRDNIFGTQFHPEKSLRHGLKVLQGFVGMT